MVASLSVIYPSKYNILQNFLVLLLMEYGFSILAFPFRNVSYYDKSYKHVETVIECYIIFIVNFLIQLYILYQVCLIISSMQKCTSFI